jgi:hypothetical protein
MYITVSVGSNYIMCMFWSGAAMVMATRTSEDKEIAGMGIAPQRFLDLQSQAIHTRLMSVRPTTSQTRTFEGTGIIAAAPARRAHAAVSPHQHRR